MQPISIICKFARELAAIRLITQGGSGCQPSSSVRNSNGQLRELRADGVSYSVNIVAMLVQDNVIAHRCSRSYCESNSVSMKSKQSIEHNFAHHRPQGLLPSGCLLPCVLSFTGMHPSTLDAHDDYDVTAIRLGAYLVCLVPGGKREADTGGGKMSAEGLVPPLHPVLPRAGQAALTLLRPLHLLGKAATTFLAQRQEERTRGTHQVRAFGF